MRVIEAYVARLDLSELGFSKAQPSYEPADLLKLYLYGYFQRIRSFLRLEVDCQRNVEVMWLLGRLVPDFKIIADFRKDNGTAFQATCRAFVQFCRQVGHGSVGGHRRQQVPGSSLCAQTPEPQATQAPAGSSGEVTSRSIWPNWTPAMQKMPASPSSVQWSRTPCSGYRLSAPTI